MGIVAFRPKKKVIPSSSKMRCEIYERAIVRFAANYSGSGELTKDNIKKLVYLNVKYVGAVNRAKREEYDISFYEKSPIKRLDILNATLDLMGLLTPAELMEIFPICKEYDGERYGVKDYFSTMEAIKELGTDKPIGSDSFSFLWDYRNMDVSRFLVELMSNMELMRMYQGKQSFMDYIMNMEPEQKEKKLPEYLKLL
ncbi:hypothetical protein [Parasporobacterium paucivorans]|uniref:Uncharacterized protein n=1 Tax=Parasporobacterium paucivorans DSM 15970 TaxID=1122934 RepID=A0A1M6F2C1_9FIRM|nr:hypothetical protein [Parasporobacterium paucivorans]SHI91786.1 hypothetical protein SAMN02745691_01031 [Parasporobacterium paucivorans DSM 15970]